MLSWIDGQPAESLSVQDRGLAYGDGLFATMGVRGAQIQLLAIHAQNAPPASCFAVREFCLPSTTRVCSRLCRLLQRMLPWR